MTASRRLAAILAADVQPQLAGQKTAMILERSVRPFASPGFNGLVADANSP
jgi:hypothetical protein